MKTAKSISMKLHRNLLNSLLGMGAKLRKRGFSWNESKALINILIVSLDYIGDYCMRTIPVIHLVKKSFQGAEISVLAGSWSSELIKTNPHIKTVEIYNPAWLDRSSAMWSVMRKIKTLFSIKRNRYDLIVDIRGSIGLSLWYLLRPAENIVCFQGIGKNIPKLLSGGANKTWEDVRNEAEKEKRSFIVISPEVKDSARNLLLGEDVDFTKKIVSLHPCANSDVKKWIPERWAFVSDTIVNNYNAEVIICGDSTSNNHVDLIFKHVKSKAHNLSGKTTLLELAALIEKSAICISIDSGPMHIAGLLDVPVVGLFGPNCPKSCRPLTNKCRLIFKDLPCADCIENMTGCRAECMEAITCDDVLKAADELNKEYKCL